jgi:hypothetical protein
MEHPGALLQTSDVQQCFLYTAVASAVAAVASSVVSSHEHHQKYNNLFY